MVMNLVGFLKSQLVSYGLSIEHGWSEELSTPNHLQGLAHDLPCVLYQPHALEVKEFYGGEE